MKFLRLISTVAEHWALVKKMHYPAPISRTGAEPSANSTLACGQKRGDVNGELKDGWMFQKGFANANILTGPQWWTHMADAVFIVLLSPHATASAFFLVSWTVHTAKVEKRCHILHSMVRVQDMAPLSKYSGKASVCKMPVILNVQHQQAQKKQMINIETRFKLLC